MEQDSMMPPPLRRLAVGTSLLLGALTSCAAPEADLTKGSADDEVTEQSQSALSVTYYDFKANAPGAYWHNNDGGVPWGTEDNRGSCHVGTKTLENFGSYSCLLTHPKKVASGFMHASYTVTIPSASYHPTATATFGFVSGASPTDGVTFALKTQVNNTWVTLFSVRKTYTGALTTATADLSAYAGQTIQLFLMADAGTGYSYDWAAWKDVRIVTDTAVPPTGCTIGGVQYADQAVNPAVSCQICDVVSNPSAWTTKADSCLIGGQCYSSDEHDSLGCKTCDPATSQTSWTNTAACDKLVVAIGIYDKYGDFGGISQADTACSNGGDPLGLPGTWKALVSKGGTRDYRDAVPGAFWSMPVVNLQGEQMFPTFDTIFSNQVWPSGISMYVFGNSTNPVGSAFTAGRFWTGTALDGTYASSSVGDNCQKWTSRGWVDFSGWHSYKALSADVAQRNMINSGESICDFTTNRRIACVLVPPGPIVTTKNYDGSALGDVMGTSDGNAFVYRGLPYAAPPTGSLRLAPPAKATAWAGVHNAFNPGPACAQSPFLPIGGYIGSEDCLYLNVWAPKTATPTSNLPVIVFHHGGGFAFGSSVSTDDWVGTGLYNGSRFAATQNAVVVTIQTRMGALGYLATSELSANATSRTSTTGGGTSGNYGLLDALQALKWVKKNIASFGGDPNHVMFTGQSAGASLAAMLLASPLAKDPADNKSYFSSVWLMSGYYEEPTMSARYTQSASTLSTLGCSSASDKVACLRSASLQKYVNATGPILQFFPNLFTGPLPPEIGFGLVFGPNIDGYVLPAQPRVRIAAGQHNKVPVVVGSTKNEANTFMVLAAGGLINIPAGDWTHFVILGTCSDRHTRAVTNLGATLAASAEALYPCSGLFDGPTTSYAQAITHAQYECPARRMARALVTGQTNPVRRYWFTHKADHIGLFQNLLGIWPGMGAAHALDLPYVFNTHGTTWYGPSQRELELTTRVQSYWKAMAANGDPNYSGGASWTAYDRNLDNALNLKRVGETGSSDPGPQMTNGIDTSICDFWDNNYTLDGWK